MTIKELYYLAGMSFPTTVSETKTFFAFHVSVRTILLLPIGACLGRAFSEVQFIDGVHRMEHCHSLFSISPPDLFCKILVICTNISAMRISLYRGNEFAILRVFESQKSPFTTKITGEFARQVSIYLRYISRKHENFRQWPNKSHDITIETPTNHRSSRRDTVFHSVENHIGITQ